mmetsp:Transcript_21123/g.65498  ORF Transcript_21123/g.65498 Transcript_21123/m.65498 type:complete len:302 (-) Transcript_21123:440-1345(-)
MAHAVLAAAPCAHERGEVHLVGHHARALAQHVLGEVLHAWRGVALTSGAVERKGARHGAVGGSQARLDAAEAHPLAALAVRGPRDDLVEEARGVLIGQPRGAATLALWFMVRRYHCGLHQQHLAREPRGPQRHRCLAEEHEALVRLVAQRGRQQRPLRRDDAPTHARVRYAHKRARRAVAQQPPREHRAARDHADAATRVRRPRRPIAAAIITANAAHCATLSHNRARCRVQVRVDGKAARLGGRDEGGPHALVYARRRQQKEQRHARAWRRLARQPAAVGAGSLDGPLAVRRGQRVRLRP